jgi:hypothetical protein
VLVARPPALQLRLAARRLVPLLLLAACGDRRAEPRGHDGGGAVADNMSADTAPAPAPPLAPLDDARLTALDQVTPPGFTVTARDRTSTSVVLALRSADLHATVTATPCLRCVPIALDRWRAIEPELRALLPGGLEDDPSTTFELAIAPIAGRPCATTYELGAASYNEELDTTHAARIYCNDGTTELVIRVDDDLVGRAPTADAARAAADRARLESAARDLAAAYLAPLTRP